MGRFLPRRRDPGFATPLILTSLKPACGVFDVQLLVHEPLRGWAAAMTNIVLSTTGTGPCTHFTIVIKYRRALPDLPEALRMQVSRLKLRCLEEGARINLTLYTDTTCIRRSSTHIKTL